MESAKIRGLEFFYKVRKMIYLIVYDLNQPGQDHEAVDNLIRSTWSNGAAIRILQSTWLVQSSMSAQQVSDKVRTVMDENDSIMVSKVEAGSGQAYAGWLPKTVWHWLVTHQ